MTPENEPSRIPEAPRRSFESERGASPTAADRELRSRLTPKLFFGILVAVVGAIFLLDNLELLDDDFLKSWWPTGIVALGLVQLCFGDSAFPRVIGLGLMLLGGLLLLGKLQPEILDPGDLWRFWPVALVLLGGSIAYGALVPKSARISRSADYTNIFALWSGQDRRVGSQTYRGGDLIAIMGGYELDLRDADIPAGEEAVLDTFSLMGGGEIRVPEDWEVSVEVVPFMGGVESKATAPPPDAPRKVLHVRGFAMMGGIEVKN